MAAVAAGQDAWAQQEVEKLLRDLPEVLKREAPGADDKERAARVCAEALTPYLKAFNGDIAPEPFETVKGALLAEGFASPFVEKVVAALLGWARTTLLKDWKASAGVQ